MNRKLLTVLVGVVILLFIFFPGSVSTGAKEGLFLWFHSVLPALLPFMILSAFMIRQQITEGVSRVVYPFFHWIFGISRAACYPAVIGFLSGYPVGAKNVAVLCRENKISKKEAQYVVSFCNNASPMFMLQYIGVDCLKLKYPAILLMILYLSAVLPAVFRKKRIGFQEQLHTYKRKEDRRNSMISSLDESILDSFLTITKIGGYIILFSIFAQFLKDILPIPEIVKACMIGLLEITTGGDMLSKEAIPALWKNSIIAALCAFGGLSSIAQTASVISDSGITIGRYLMAKICQSFIAFVMAMLLFQI